ncbi:Hint domain-containing protein [Phaeovulum sp.]|uniref:Hint domain-containing protein n=1 Tax=Phaeovulum sp. TaxID=2934796 RepID=UPI0039E24CCE
MAKLITGHHAMHGTTMPQPTSTRYGGIARGSEVRTTEGPLPVEYLLVGDSVVTHSGVQKITHIHQTMIVGPMIGIRSCCLGFERPTQALLLAPQTRVLLRDWRARVLYGKKSALVPVERLVDDAFIAPIASVRVQIYTLTLDASAAFYANGVEIGTEPMRVTAKAAPLTRRIQA